MFAYLYRKLYTELLQSDDDFFTRCRKAVITIYFVFGIINILTVTAAVVTSTGKALVLDSVNTALFYLASVIWIVSWAYSRITRTSPDWLMNIIIDMCLGFGVIMHFSSPNWGYHASALVVAFQCIVIGTSHMKLQVAVRRSTAVSHSNVSSGEVVFCAGGVLCLWV